MGRKIIPLAPPIRRIQKQFGNFVRVSGDLALSWQTSCQAMVRELSDLEDLEDSRRSAGRGGSRLKRRVLVSPELLGSKYLTNRAFPAVTLSVAGEVADAVQAVALSRFIPNLMIASDLELTCDGVVFGHIKSASHGKRHVMLIA